MAARGYVKVNEAECKGCELCVQSCPPKCLELSPELSPYGVHPAKYTGEGCTGCGICFYCCPEPGGITVYREKKGTAADKAKAAELDIKKEAAYAATV
jgi:Pyruvate/2-oxoacid:ferredoxin oxidoreductase delta subunit